MTTAPLSWRLIALTGCITTRTINVVYDHVPNDINMPTR